jgi:hypothetical protein
MYGCAKQEVRTNEMSGIHVVELMFSKPVEMIFSKPVEMMFSKPVEMYLLQSEKRIKFSG